MNVLTLHRIFCMKLNTPESSSRNEGVHYSRNNFVKKEKVFRTCQSRYFTHLRVS